MQQSQPTEERPSVIPDDVRERVMPAVFDELFRWGVERFSVEAMAERHGLDVATIYRYLGDRQRLIVDAALTDVENYGSAEDTGSLRGDLTALACKVTDRANSDVGRTMLRSLVMDRHSYHDEEIRMRFWRAHFSLVHAVVDRGRERGEIRDGVSTLAAVQIVLAPLISPAARADLDAIWDYTFERWDEDQAGECVREIQRAIERIVDNPMIGRACEEPAPATGCTPSEQTLYYRQVGGNVIDVVRIFHQRMDVDRHLGRPECKAVSEADSTGDSASVARIPQAV